MAVLLPPPCSDVYVSAIDLKKRFATMTLLCCGYWPVV